MQEREPYIIEFIPVGKMMKVVAIDPETLKEVVITGPVTASKRELARIAVQKLEYVLGRK